MKTKGEKIADYAYLSKGYKFWNLWIGNPFCIELYKIPIADCTLEKVIKDVIKVQKKEKKRFAKQFPDVEW